MSEGEVRDISKNAQRKQKNFNAVVTRIGYCKVHVMYRNISPCGRSNTSMLFGGVSQIVSQNQAKSSGTILLVARLSELRVMLVQGMK